MHFQVKNTLKKTATTLPPNILYMFFATHKFQPQFLPNTYLNPTNHN
jgi:hypothetical protein